MANLMDRGRKKAGRRPAILSGGSELGGFATGCADYNKKADQQHRDL
jgi:hypothetical protein